MLLNQEYKIFRCTDHTEEQYDHKSYYDDEYGSLQSEIQQKCGLSNLKVIMCNLMRLIFIQIVLMFIIHLHHLENIITDMAHHSKRF